MNPLDQEKRELDLPSDAATDRVLAALSLKQEEINPLKREAIRSVLLDAASRKKIMKFNPFFWIIPAGAVLAFVLFLSSQTATVSLPEITGRRQVAVAERLGFDALPALKAEGAKAEAVAVAIRSGIESAAEPEPSADEEFADTAALAAPSAEGLAAGVSAPTAAARTKTAAKPAPTRVQYLPPRIVYEFKGAMPEIPAELPVYRLQKLALPPDAALAFLKAVGLSGFGSLSVQNLSFTEEGENPLTWTLDGNSQTLSFWRQGPIYALAEGGAGISADTAIVNKPIASPPTSNLQPPISNLSDAEALQIASEFLSLRGIDLSKYGTPFVQRFENGWPCKVGPCPLLESGEIGSPTEIQSRTSGAPTSNLQPRLSSGAPVSPEMFPSPIWWNPGITVIYPALREDTPLLGWDASPQPGITLSINTQTRQPDNGSISLIGPADRSLYPARSASDILSDALHGGLNPYWTDGGIYPPELEKKRPVITITFNTATLGLVERYAEDGSQTRYLIPIVGFRGTLKDQYGNVSDYGTLVPALKVTSEGGGEAGEVSGTELAPPPMMLPQAVPLRK